MPSRAFCPECEAAFAYAPVLVGKTVQCRQCAHQFTVSSPPPDDTPVTVPATVAAAKPLMPPPLPARVVKDSPSRSAASQELPKAEPTDPTASEDRRPRRRSEPRERTGNAGVLLGLAATILLGCFVVIGGVIYMLWPNSSKTTSAAAQGPTPAFAAPMAEEPPKRLEDIIRDAPPRVGNAGGAAFPEFQPPPFGPPRLRGPGGPPPGEMPAFPGGPPLGPPRLVGKGPKFADIVPLPIKPARLSGDRMEVSLPGPVEAVAVAGGGRLLLLHSPFSRKVFVFDVNEARLTKEIDVPDAGALIAGGMNVFVIYQPERKVIERWNCERLVREVEVRQPFNDPVRALAMGSASNGPLAVAMAGDRKTFDGGCTLGYFDPGTMKEIRYPVAGARPGFGIGNERSAAEVRVSADGRLVTGWGPGTISGAETNRLEGGQVMRSWHPLAPRPLLPGPDGKAVFGPGQVVTPELPGRRPGKLEALYHFVPAVRGNWYVSVPVGVFEPPGKPPAETEIFRVGDKGPLLRLAADGVDQSRAEHGMDRSVVLVPDAKVLITMAGPKRAKLILRRVELK